MRRPEDGVGRSTDSHVFFIYARLPSEESKKAEKHILTMKTELLVLSVLFLFVTSLSIKAQTYYYIPTKIIDKNGVIKKPTGNSTYISFTRQSAYFSDSNGYSTGGITYLFKEYDNQGNSIYGHYLLGGWMDNDLIVSQDKSVVNWDFGGLIQVYHRSTPSNDPNRNSRLIR